MAPTVEGGDAGERFHFKRSPEAGENLIRATVQVMAESYFVHGFSTGERAHDQKKRAFYPSTSSCKHRGRGVGRLGCRGASHP